VGDFVDTVNQVLDRALSDDLMIKSPPVRAGGLFALAHNG